MKTVIQLDGWKIAVDWHKYYHGDSLFIPSVNTVHDRNAIVDSAQEAGCVIAIKRVIEDDVQGLRVWVQRGVL